jgi:hypothetical protein
MHLVGDCAPGKDVGRLAENLVRHVRVEIGRRHGAHGALTEAPRRGGIGLCDLLQHLHEDFRRNLGATDALRQQRAIKPVLDQGGNHRLGETARPLDLVGLARDQGRQRLCALD